MVAKGTVSLRDGTHPDDEGFEFRSYVTAAAVARGCAPLSARAPRPRSAAPVRGGTWRVSTM